MIPPASRRGPATPDTVPLRGALAAAAVCLGFAAFTGHIWEDYFITFRASLNLASGHGLVFQPGERVHTFTSPLGTLLPALFALGGGENVALRALWGLRIVSAFCVGGAVWLALRAFRRDGLAPLAATTAALAWIADAKTVDFSMNGMETGLVVFLVVYTWHAFASGARFWPCVLACAGLQWTRPDGCIYFAAIAGAWLLLGETVKHPASHEAGHARRAWNRVARLVRGGTLADEPHGVATIRNRGLFLLRVIALAMALYLPWFLFAWIYYGSPIPHTILAKANFSAEGGTLWQLVLTPWNLLFSDVPVHELFQPTYYFFGGWPEGLHWVSRLLAVGAALTWLWPRVAHAGRLASAAFFLGSFYVNLVPPFPWYYPGWAALAFIAWAYLLHTVMGRLPGPSAAWPQRLLRITAAVFVLTQVGILLGTAWQMRNQQTLIEDNHRAVLGRWLRDQAGPRDTVFLECLGYIGYYSQLKMLDYPGLAAPEVVAARRAGHKSWAQIITLLHPDWLVLRPDDARKVFGELPSLQAGYRMVRAFNARAAIDAIPLLPGRGYLNFDSVFLVYHRNPPEAAGP